MKKILAVLLALTLVLSMTPVFAEETSTETDAPATFVPSPENYDAIGNATKITTGWIVAGGTPTPAVGNFFSTKFTSGNIVVYKVALPAPSNGQTYDKFVIRFGVGGNGGAVFKMPGENWDMTQPLTGTDWYTTITNSTNATKLKAYEGSILYGPESSSYRNAYADITEYAKECWYAGQDYMYLAVGCIGSTSGACMPTVSDSSYLKFAPTTLHSFKTVEPSPAVENTAEAMMALGHETRIPAANGFYSSGGSVIAAPKTAGVKITDGKFVIVKIDLPEIPAGYTLGNFAFRYGNISNSMEFELYKMPDVYGDLPTDIKSTAWYTNIKSRKAAYKANDDVCVITDGLVSASYHLAYFNITSYIKECYAKGYEYCYLAYGCGSTVNAASPTTTDGTYTKNGLQPRFYYSLDNVGALELVSSPAKTEILSSKEVTFTFSNKIASATATVDGVEYPCTVDNSQVKLNFDNTGEYRVQVTAKDNARQTVTTDAMKVRVGYESIKLTESVAKTYKVSSSGSSQSKYNSEVNTGMATVLTIPLPTLEAGKKLGEFKLKFLTEVAYDPDWYHLFKIPMDSENIANFIVKNDAPEGKVSIYEYFEGAPNVYKANFGRFTSEATDIPYTSEINCNASFADLTAYANECIERGQKDMLVGFRTSMYTKGIIAIGDSTHAKNNRYHYAYWTVEDADFSAKAPKFVESSDANTFATATGLADLTKGSTYKCITSLANFGVEAFDATVYVAQYNDNGELVSIAPQSVTVPADGVAADYAVANITIDANASNVKAFIWNDDLQKPMLIGDVIVEAK